MAQLIANILFTASGTFIVAIGFLVIYSTARFFHFAHAAVITCGAYFCFVANGWLHIPMLGSVLIAVIAAGVMGWLLNGGIYRQMRKRFASSLILLVSSLGLNIVLQNVVSISFGDDTKLLGAWTVDSGSTFLGARLTSIQITTVFTALVVFVVMAAIFSKLRLGLMLKAVADNPELSEYSGIRREKVLSYAFVIGSGLAGLSGCLIALDVGMTPTMGLPALLMGVVAIIMGGTRRVSGIATASVLLAVFQQIAGWYLGSHWQEVAAFLLLLAFLGLKPEGIWGRPVRRASL